MNSIRFAGRYSMCGTYTEVQSALKLMKIQPKVLIASIPAPRFGEIYSYNMTFLLNEQERDRFKDVAGGNTVEIARSNVNGPFFKVGGRLLPMKLGPRQREFIDYLRHQIFEELGKYIKP